MTAHASPLLVALTILAVALPSLLQQASAATYQTARQSVTSNGGEVHGANMMPAVSGNGRYVAFASDASDIMPANGANRDVFLRDRQTGELELISVAHHGAEANGGSLLPGTSADGRHVVFESQASDIVDDDDQNFTDIYLRDRMTGTTRRVNLTPEGDGADGEGRTPSISSNGRFVTYTSAATDILPEDLNMESDVFLVDLQTNQTELISIATDGTQGNLDSGHFGAGEGRVSGDGRFVVFGSFASSLVPEDNNNKDDVFVRDRLLGTTERVSVASDGTEGNDHSVYGTISDDGRFVAYFSTASTLVPEDTNNAADAFLFDRQTHETIRISGRTELDEANGASRFPEVSDDGRYVAFQSLASNLVPDDSNDSIDIFRYMVATGETERVSVADGGVEAHGNSTTPSISADGAVIAYASLAPDLVPGDGNGVNDIFSWGKPIGSGQTPTPTQRPPTPTATVSGSTGDANGDGRIDSIDAALVLQFTAGLLPNISPNADANDDDEVSSVDAALILQYSAGLVPSLPP